MTMKDTSYEKGLYKGENRKENFRGANTNRNGDSLLGERSNRSAH